MPILTKEALLGASDLTEKTVDVPSLGDGAQVRVRSLAAAYSNQAISEAMETQVTRRGEQTSRVNTAKLEALQVLHGMIEPQLLTLDEVMAFQQRVGRAWRVIVDKIDEISGVDKEAIEKANEQFQHGGPAEAGAVVGNGSAAREGSG